MSARLSHLQINVADAATSLPFYRDFFAHLGYRVVSEGAEHLGASDGTATVWIIAATRAHARTGFHRKNVGLNHLAFRVATRQAVDACFEDPDRIKLEVVHLPV